MSDFNESVNAIMKEIHHTRSKIIEDFIKAYLADTGLDIRDIELCEQTVCSRSYPPSSSEHRFFFRKKSPEVKEAPPIPVASEERQIEYVMKAKRAREEWFEKEIGEMKKKLEREKAWSHYLYHQSVWTVLKRIIKRWVGKVET